MVEEPNVIALGSYHKIFIHIISLRFNDKERDDKVESWLVEVEKAFDMIELS